MADDLPDLLTEAEAAELDLLVVSGAMEAFLMSVAAEQRVNMRAKLGMIDEEWSDDD